MHNKAYLCTIASQRREVGVGTVKVRGGSKSRKGGPEYFLASQHPIFAFLASSVIW
jgi:hypothetical protein